MAVVLVVAIVCIVLLSFSTVPYSITGTDFTVPCTINSYGNAWSGQLAFDLEISSGSSAPQGNYLVIMDTDGNLLNLRQSSTAYGVVYTITSDTVMFQGEPKVDGPGSAPTYATHFWNLSDGSTVDFPNVISHHDLQYDPVNNTFLTLQSYVRDVGNNVYLFDKIVQVDPSGNVLWSWDVYDHIPLSQASVFNETSVFNGQTLIDFSHANSLDWDYNNGIIYLNLRCTNTFYKIDQTTGNLVWSCGEFGNFTLLDENGNQVSSLWYHSHDTKQIAPDVFTMFDNDYNNVTNPDDCHSRMIKLIVNETSMTAFVDWSWEAPKQYWNSYAGGTVLLPNGDYLGDFGDPTHQVSQNQPWNFNDTGAVLIEVTPAGQVMKTFTFPVGCYIYRVLSAISLPSGNFVNSSPSPSTPTPTPLAPEAPTLVPSTPASPTSTPANSPEQTQVASPTFTTLPPSNTKHQVLGFSIQLTIAIALVVAVIVAFVVFYLKRKNYTKP